MFLSHQSCSAELKLVCGVGECDYPRVLVDLSLRTSNNPVALLYTTLALPSNSWECEIRRRVEK
jgi:hypothetical protein